MPDTSTATTASNAETRAAGSKIIGFILGGGGAIVDKLFDLSNFFLKDAAGRLGVGTAAPVTDLEVSGNTPIIRATQTNNTAAFYGYELSAGGLIDGSFKSSLIAGEIRVSAGRSVGWGGYLTFHTDTTEKMRIASNGNVGIGTVGFAPASRLHVKSSSEIARLETTTARGSGGNYQAFFDATGRKGFVGYGAIDDRLQFINEMAANVEILAGGYGIVCEPGGDFRPSTTGGGQNLGKASHRWAQLYAVTNVISTSDEREKTWRGCMSAAELTAARRIVAELGFYQWNDAIALKGDDARLHFGPRAQQVWAIMADEGLIDPLDDEATPDSKYAFLCWDGWDEVPDVDAVEEELDDENNVIVPALPAQPGHGAGNRFGVRTDQLALFLIAAQEARIAALEAA